MIIRLITLTIFLLKAAILPAEATLRPLITKEQIHSKIHEAAGQIAQDFEGKDLVIIMVLKGAVCLVADLIRELPIPLDLEAVQCSSYSGTTQRGQLKVIGAERIDVRGRDVLIVDDIFDSGNTLATLVNTFKEQNPRSMKTCVLLYKNGVPKTTDYRPDYVLFDIEDLFVVGYGLDYQEKYRGLPDVCVLDDL